MAASAAISATTSSTIAEPLQQTSPTTMPTHVPPTGASTVPDCTMLHPTHPLAKSTSPPPPPSPTITTRTLTPDMCSTSHGMAEYMQGLLRQSPDFPSLHTSDDAAILQSRFGGVWAAFALLRAVGTAPPTTAHDHTEMGLWAASARQRIELAASLVTTYFDTLCCMVDNTAAEFQKEHTHVRMAPEVSAKVVSLLQAYHAQDTAPTQREHIRRALALVHGRTIKHIEASLGVAEDKSMYAGSASSEHTARHNTSKRARRQQTRLASALRRIGGESGQRRSMLSMYFL